MECSVTADLRDGTVVSDADEHDATGEQVSALLRGCGLTPAAGTPEHSPYAVGARTRHVRFLRGAVPFVPLFS